MKKLFQKLDILNSKNLFKTVDNKWFNSIPNRYKKGLSEIKPDFFYVQENKPIILFFEGDIKDKNTFTKIWNLGGVPIIYNINNGLIDIYNGFDFDKENENFKLINSSKESDNLDFSIWDILSGNIWNNKTFTKSSLVDEELLNNLKNTRDLLISDNYKLDNVSASNLIGRLLFSRYLVDREVQMDDKFKEYFTSKNAFSSLIKGNKDKLYEYFNYLKDTFNIEFTINNNDNINHKLQSIDIDNIFLEGILITDITPSIKSEYDNFGMHIHEFKKDLNIEGDNKVIFSAKAIKKGDYSGNVDICIDTDVSCFYDGMRILIK